MVADGGVTHPHEGQGDRIPAILSEGWFSPYSPGGYISSAASMPVHLDDDECVVHQGPHGWVCARALHVGMACQSSADGTEQPSTPHADTT